MKYKILTGDRATGPLHLGHFMGSLKQRVQLQNEHQQFILIADLQGLTDNGQNPKKVSSNILNIMADYLAVGINPSKSTICLQSSIPALSELTMYYSNVVSVSRLERNPTVKAEISSKAFGNSIPAGFLTYPISQAADITAFRANCVPAGDDQLPMIEQTNEIVRKINHIAGREILVECKTLLSKTPRLPGIDGKGKMSKSLGNAITLGAEETEITAAVKKMYTDANHLRMEDPGCLEGNVVFNYLDAFHPDENLVLKLKEQYTKGGLGDSKVKKILEECLQETLAPIRNKRKAFLQDKAFLIETLKNGTLQGIEETNLVLNNVKQAFGLNIFN